MAAKLSITATHSYHGSIGVNLSGMSYAQVCLSNETITEWIDALSSLGAFILMCVLVKLYREQHPPQPKRDADEDAT